MQLRPEKQRRWRSRYREPKPAEIVERRFIILKVAILVLFGALLLQLARMQIVHHDEYAARAESNRLRTVAVLPARGLIYDRNGQPLVENQPIFSAGVVAADVPEGQLLTVAAELSTITGVPAAEIAGDIDKAARSKDPFTPVIVKENIDEETAFSLRERQPHLPGVQVLVESVRRYAYGSLLSHSLGFVGRIDEEEYGRLHDRGYLLNDRLGKAGAEFTYESVLRGTAGYRQVEVDAAGQEVRTIKSVDPRPAGNLVLSLDLDLERKVTEYLQKAQGNSQNAVAIVMNVRTGELLSMVSLPAYDNNVFSATVDQNELQRLLDDPAKPMLNHAIAEVYPPGSTFKQVTGTAALQEGVATADTTIFSGGAIYVPREYGGGEDRFADWRAHGSMNFYRGLAMSSDVYFYYLSGGYHAHGIAFDGLGATRLARYAREYGFGAPTGIDLPGEAAGIVPDPEWKQQTFGEDAIWYLGDTYHFGIGQGYLAVTPLQLLRVIAAIANDGNVMVPHIAKEVVDEQGNVLKTIEPEVQHKLSISDQNLGIMREALRQAAVYGPARTGASQYVTIAAKTGTAEFGQQLANGSYATSHAWYTGYAPFDDPEIAVVVFLEKGIGATNAGPVAKQIFDYYFQRKHLAEGEAQP